MEFHLTFSGSLSSLLKFAQRHITLKTKGTPCLLKVICRKHSDNILIHRLQQRCGVRLKKDKLYITMQILQHFGVGGSIVEDHQDTEGETLICAILLQLMHQGNRAVHLENVSRHPTSGIGVPVDRQAGLFIAPECTRGLGMVHHDRLKLAVSLQVSPQQEGETVLEHFEALGRLLLPRDVRAFRYFLSLQARVIHIEHLLGLVTPSSMMALRRSG